VSIFRSTRKYRVTAQDDHDVGPSSPRCISG